MSNSSPVFNYFNLELRYSTRIDFFTNRTFSVPYQTMLDRYAKKKFVSPKIIRFAKSAVREKFDARTVQTIKLSMIEAM
jgi:hypothetical protein